MPPPVAPAVAPSDAELLQRYADHGAHEAFATLVERHIALIQATCREHLGAGHPWLDDATQAVCLILARRAKDIRDPQALPAWLRTTARGVAANVRKTERRRRLRELDSQEGEVAVQGPSQDAALAQAEVRLRLEQAIATLTPAQREAVVRHFLQDKRQAEVAEELGITTGAVKKRIADAMVALRTLFQAEGALPSVLAWGGQEASVSPHLLERCLTASRLPGSARAVALAHAASTAPVPWAGIGALVALAVAGVLALALVVHRPHPGPADAHPGSAPAILANRVPAPLPPAANTPEGAVLDLLAAVQHNDVAAVLRCLPPATQADIHARWTRFARTPAPVSDALADVGLALVARGLAIDDPAVGYQPLTRDLYHELRQLAEQFSARGDAASARLLADLARDLHGYASTLPTHDLLLMQRVAQARLDTGHVWGLTSMAQARQLSFPTVVQRLSAVLASVKRWWLPYGLDVDRVLGSARVVRVAGTGPTRTLTLALTAFGHPYQTTLVVTEQHGQWTCPTLEVALAESFTALSHYFYLPTDFFPPPAPVVPDEPEPTPPTAPAPEPVAPNGHT